MKKKLLISFTFILSLSFTTELKAQDNLADFLVLGADVAEDLAAEYTAPAAEGLMYGLTGGWYNSAVVKEKWTVDVSIVANGSFVPSEKRSFVIDTNEFENLSLPGGDEATVVVPTILGGDTTPLQLEALVDGVAVDFETPEGLGLANLNLLPSAFLQAKVAMPGYTEVGFRYFPKITIDDTFSAGITGFSAMHEFSRWIKPMEQSKISLAGFVAFTSLKGTYDLEDGDITTGVNQGINLDLDSWLFSLVASTRFPIFNVYGGIGYVTGSSDLRLVGTYIIDVDPSVEPLNFQDPINVENEVSGLRANLGVKVRMGWFTLNTAYTFQGYNNLSLGLNFQVTQFKKEQPY